MTGARRTRLDAVPLLAATGACVGGRVGEALGAGSGALLLVGAGGVACGALLTRGALCRGLLLLVPLLVAGAAMQRGLDGIERHPFATTVEERATVSVRGNLVGDPHVTRFHSEATVRVARIALGDAAPQSPGGDRHVLVTAGGDVAGRLALLEAGDRVTLRGWLAPLSGRERRARWEHVTARLDVQELVDFEGSRSPLIRSANWIRALVLRGLDRLPPVERGVIAAALVGDTSALPAETYTAFRDAGLSHLLVVSGSNLAFVLLLVSPLLRRLGPGPRLVLGVGVVVLFAAVTRFEPSVLRASVMTGLAMLAAFSGRPVAATRTLGSAMVVLVVADPFLIHSVAFGLSCAATAGIVLLAGPVARRVPGPAVVSTAVGVTVGAQVGVTPMLLATFGRVPLVSVPANLVAVPIAAPLTTWGLAAGLVGGVIGEGPLTEVLQAPSACLARTLAWVATQAAAHPVPLDAPALAGVVAVLAAGAALANLRRDGGAATRGEAS